MTNSMNKLRTTFFVSPDVLEALKVFVRTSPRFKTTSQAADHLLREVLPGLIGQEHFESIQRELRAEAGERRHHKIKGTRR